MSHSFLSKTLDFSFMCQLLLNSPQTSGGDGAPLIWPFDFIADLYFLSKDLITFNTVFQDSSSLAQLYFCYAWVT